MLGKSLWHAQVFNIAGNLADLTLTSDIWTFRRKIQNSHSRDHNFDLQP